MLHLSNNIRYIRTLSGMTQEEFGLKFNANKNKQYTYERGLAEPDGLYQLKVAEMIGLSVEDLRQKDLTKYEIQVKDPDTKDMEFVIAKTQLDVQERELFEKLLKSKEDEIRAKDELIKTLQKIIESTSVTTKQS